MECLTAARQRCVHGGAARPWVRRVLLLLPACAPRVCQQAGAPTLKLPCTQCRALCALQAKVLTMWAPPRQRTPHAPPGPARRLQPGYALSLSLAPDDRNIDDKVDIVQEVRLGRPVTSRLAPAMARPLTAPLPHLLRPPGRAGHHTIVHAGAGGAALARHARVPAAHAAERWGGAQYACACTPRGAHARAGCAPVLASVPKAPPVSPES